MRASILFVLLLALALAAGAGCAAPAASDPADTGGDAALADSEDGEHDAIVVPAGCPLPLSLLALDPVATACAPADAGTICRYPALLCAPGGKPDIECTCTAYASGTASWRCAAPFANCLPFAVGGRFADGTRPYPTHRAAAAACADPAADPRAATCASASGGDEAPTCAANSDCAPDQVCLGETFHVATCKCFGAGCLSDSDCGAGRVCQCGVMTAGTTCFQFGGACGHRCVPAGCQTDADCGAGGLCVATRDSCGAIERYVCNDPLTDVCTVDAECADGQHCVFDDAAGWRCESPATCF